VPKLQAGDVVEVDFGWPTGSVAGFRRPAVVVTAEVILAAQPRALQVVPVTSNTTRRLPFDLELGAPLPLPSAAQVHLLTTIDRGSLTGVVYGNVGATELLRLRELISDLLDLPGL